VQSILQHSFEADCGSGADIFGRADCQSGWRKQYIRRDLACELFEQLFREPREGMMHYPPLPIVLARPRLPGHRGVEASQNCSSVCPCSSFIPPALIERRAGVGEQYFVPTYRHPYLRAKGKARHCRNRRIELVRVSGFSGGAVSSLGSRIVSPHV